MDLVAEVRRGKLRAIARTISLIEDLEPEAESLVDALYPHTGRSLIVGVTGSPGAGKSTLVDKLITLERGRGRKVAVIAVDPSSPFSGGAILGDRLRMQTHATDPGVFIRSMASRGFLGGIAAATGDVIKVLDAAGYQSIFIETIGVGQTEIKIVELSDIVVLVLMPGAGDEIQAMKAGVMEIGDIFVINKKDLPGADKLLAEVQYVLSFKNPTGRSGERNQSEGGGNPVLMTSAARDEGIEQLHRAIGAYAEEIDGSGRLADKRRFRLQRELLGILTRKVHELMDVQIEVSKQLPQWAESLYRHRARPYALINEQIGNFLREKSNDREN
ncbi:MAG: methylmalonyl Co-A mutase-associated GTPase MeaB [Spirochaetales bacterium]|nr:methylmalonyl Co-A mutase-associated GTPase MeaB [Spirochaetales bacterium]